VPDSVMPLTGRCGPPGSGPCARPPRVPATAGEFMGGQIGTWTDAGIAGTADAADGRGLATLIRRLAPGYDGQRPAGLIAGCICVCAGELPQAGVRSGLVPANGAMTGAAWTGACWQAPAWPGLRRIAVREAAGCAQASRRIPDTPRRRCRRARPGRRGRSWPVLPPMRSTDDRPGG